MILSRSILFLPLSAVCLCAAAQSGVASGGAAVLAADTSVAIAEVRVTAAEARGAATSASLIGPVAMEHLQPASLADVLSLLPGGLTKTPQMGQANIIALREVPSSSVDYAVSALGTKVLIDGAPVGVDANLQSISTVGQTDSDNGRSSVNSGVDLRSIPTDEIEAVEVLRGVPSVSHGDLTSGVVSVRRRLAPSPLTVRFKADPYSKLVSASRGFETPGGWVVSAGAGFLSSEVDPRCEYETYRRANVSLRGSKDWALPSGLCLSWRPVADYSQNVDGDKADPEQQVGADDAYRSSYVKFSFSNTVSVRWADWRAELAQSLSFSHDVVRQSMRFVNAQNLYAPSDSVDGLAHFVSPLERDYVARHKVDGRPFYSNLRLSVSRPVSVGSLTSRVSIGGEWLCAKNFGRGQVFDPTRPLHGSTSRRPRSFRSIPASNVVGLYAEDDCSVKLSDFTLRLVLGVRLSLMAGLNSDLAMAGRLYADPRANLSLVSPSFGSKDNVRLTLDVGVGRMSKMPTISQLYPEDQYFEFTEFDYWNANPSLRRRITRAYAVSPDSKSLEPARNVKLDVRLGARAGRHSASVSLFREVMDDGFRPAPMPVALSYVRYRPDASDPSYSLRMPSLESVPSTTEMVVRLSRPYVNGSHIEKVGAEWQYDSPRLPVVATRLSVCGAWLRTSRANSGPEWYQGAGVTVGGVVVDDYYAGLYDWHQTNVAERVSTNFTAETYMESVGFIFSATAECVWLSTKSIPLRNARPVAYVGGDGVVRPYTDAQAADATLSHLVISNTADRVRTSERPYATFNFKATKEIGKVFRLSFFADRLLSAARDYEKDGFTVRRTFSPYFGAQASVSLF